MIGAFIRRSGFWILDFVRGGKVLKHYLNIKKDKNESSQMLNKILDYSRKHVLFYQNINSNNIKDFPVTTKKFYRENGIENFLSDEYKNAKLHHVFTSGSTGNPFEVVQNQDKRNRVIADLINCHTNISWKLGDKYVFMRNWVSNYDSSRLKSFIQNVKCLNVSSFNDEAKEDLCKYLIKHKNTILFGYASSLVDFANYISLKGIDGKTLNLKIIVSDSDELSNHNKEYLGKTFGVKVFNRYDNEENGLLGISKYDDNKIYLNTHSLYFELLKLDSDDSVEPGEIGRIVVTDFYNRAMPLIRYDLGDLGVSNDEEGNIKILTELSGRKFGVLKNQDGRLISNVSISGIMEPFTKILKYQVCQVEKSSKYIISYIGDLSSEDITKIESRLKDCFGNSSKIFFKKVLEIENGKNGKFVTTKIIKEEFKDFVGE